MHRATALHDLSLNKLEKYVGPVPTYYAAVHLAQTSFCTEERSYKFWFLYAFFLQVRSSYETDGQTDRRTDGRLIKTAT